jgi:hypothetical protein
MNNFKIIGISTETTNENGQSIRDVEEILGRNIYRTKYRTKRAMKFILYTDYESDYIGKHTLIIGFPVTTLNSILAGFVGQEISVGKNEKYIQKVSSYEKVRISTNMIIELLKKNGMKIKFNEPKNGMQTIIAKK